MPAAGYHQYITSHHIETTDAGLDGLCIREITVYHTIIKTTSVCDGSSVDDGLALHGKQT